MPRGCLSEGFLHPRDIRGVAYRVFGRIRSDVAKIVARSLDVQRGIRDTVHGPAPIFDARNGAAHSQARRGGLNLLMNRMLSKRERGAEEQGAFFVQLCKRR